MKSFEKIPLDVVFVYMVSSIGNPVGNFAYTKYMNTILKYPEYFSKEEIIIANEFSKN